MNLQKIVIVISINIIIIIIQYYWSHNDFSIYSKFLPIEYVHSLKHDAFVILYLPHFLQIFKLNSIDRWWQLAMEIQYETKRK